MTAQLAFVYSPAAAGGQSWRGEDGQGGELAAIRDAVAHLTAKEVCFELNIGKSALSDAMAERTNEAGQTKRWAGEWTHVLVAMLMRRGDETSIAIIRKIIASRAIGTPFVVEENDVTDADVLAAERVIAAAKRRKARTP